MHSGRPDGWALETNEVLDVQAAGDASEVDESVALWSRPHVVDSGMGGDEDDGVGGSDGVVERHALEPEQGATGRIRRGS